MVSAHAGCSQPYTTYITTQLGYIAFYKGGELVGAAMDFYRELQRRSQCEIRVNVVPVGRLAALSAAGKLPLLAMAAETPGPAHRFIPLVAMSMDMLVRRELEIDSVEQARLDPRVGFGIVDGLTYGPWGDRFLAQLPPARVDRSPSIDTIYRKLVANRVQATFGFSLNYQRNLDLDGLRDNVRIVPVPDAPRGVIGLKLFAAQLPDADAALLQKTAVEIRDDGTLERLLGHWVDHGLAHNLVWRTERDGPSSKP